MNCSRVLIFQFMSPQGDEHKAVSLFISLLLFQLTSPRGDEPVFIGCIPFDIIISTRVSARRRTAIQHLFPAPENISTHVSVRRRTKFPFLMVSHYSNFNSRLLAKTNSCFLSYHILFNLLQLTSPQGDEQYGLSPITVWCHFNSRLRKETNPYNSVL